MELRPHGELMIKGRLPNIRRRIPHGVQTLVAVAAADDPAKELNRDKAQEATGRWRVAHLIAWTNYTGRESYLKAQDHCDRLTSTRKI